MKRRIRDLLDRNDADRAITLLEEYHREGGAMDEDLFYLQGNAWRKKGDWQQAMNNYLEAVHLNPDSPARQALEMANGILAFYNKDMYNP